MFRERQRWIREGFINHTTAVRLSDKVLAASNSCATS